MDKAIWLQKQVRDNSEDLQKEFLDMKAWEEQMKKKDLEIRHSKNDQDKPPVRKKKKKKVTPKEESKDEKQCKEKRISSYDYRSWDKFDVDKACEEVDGDNTTKITKEIVFEIPSKEELNKEHEEALKLKQEGNDLVQRRKYAKAVGKYNEAIKIYPHDAVFYANRALCQLKLDNVFSAVSDCTAAIKLDSKYVKAFHRRALAYVEVKRFKDALRDIETILQLDPSNKEASILLTQLQNKVEKSEKTMIISGDEKEEKNISIEKKMMERFLGKQVSLDKEKESEPKPSSTNETEDISIKVEHKHASQAEEFMQNQILKQKAALEKLQEPEGPKSINDLTPSWMPKLKDHIDIVECFEEISRKINKNLVRVTIEEVPSNESIFKEVEDAPQKTDKHVVVEKTDSDKQKDIENENEQTVEENRSSDEQKVINNENNINNVIHEEKSESLPPAPKTSVAFIMTWRKNVSLDFRYKYFKQIKPKELPDIFKETMESNIFSEIISLLKLKFTPNNDKVYDYLYYLTKVKRFRALILFFTKADKEALELLFEYCKSKEGKTEEDVQNLRTSYEM